MKIYNLTMALLVLLVSTQAHALQARVTGNITSILTDGRLYGGCMVFAPTEKPLAEYGLNCRNNYFTLDCKNETDRPGGKAQANINLQQAQLALVTGYTVDLVVNDQITINGNCYAARVTLYNK